METVHQRAAGGRRIDARRSGLLGALLAGAVIAVYGQVWNDGFVVYDDPGFVSDNPHVARGFTLEGIGWALTTGHMGNWNPVTWGSHMLDVQLFGMHAGAHHLVNVALHLANTLLLFAVLQRMTRAPWPSFVVAALFAVHPLHVESVAWISERKDVLSTFFWFLMLWAYVRYAETAARRWYAATVAALALGLMSKPMLVTAPFVLLLLDLWPLERLAWPRRGSPAAHPSRRGGPAPASRVGARPLSSLWWEKAPLFALVAAFSVVALLMQSRAGAMAPAEYAPLDLRIANALVSYVRYLAMAAWPQGLAVLYPYDRRLPLWQPVAAALLLVAVSALVLRHARRHPYALVGWLWYLGTLVPVIGLVQIGEQALADRYTYVPLIGVLIMIAWGGRSLLARWALPPPLVGAALAALIGGYAVAAWAQVGVWRDGRTLFEHALRVTRDNGIAHNNLGGALQAQGESDAAMEHFREALRINPAYADALSNVGNVLWRQGRREDAVEQFHAALRYAPNTVITLSNLGGVLTELGRADEAIAPLTKALELDPHSANAHNNLGNALRKSGQLPQAIEQFEAALRINPELAAAHNNIGAIRALQGQRDEAAAQFRRALASDPEFVEAQRNLGLVLIEMDQPVDAIPRLSDAIRLGADDAVAYYKLGLATIQVGRPAEAIVHFEQALRRNPDYAEAHNDLGVALVSTGQLSAAIEHFERALQLDPNLADAHTNIEIARAMQQSAAQAGGPGGAVP